MSILFLGGGGWVGVTTAYAPGHALSVRVTIGIAVAQQRRLTSVLPAARCRCWRNCPATFVSDASGNRSGPAITIGLLTFGELSILGLVSAYIGLGYSVTYDGGDGSLTGTGWLAVRIKICWCVEVNVSKAVTVRLAGSGGRQSQQTPLMASQSAPDYGAMAEREMANLAF